MKPTIRIPNDLRDVAAIAASAKDIWAVSALFAPAYAPKRRCARIERRPAKR
jgi:hypothetical protein